MRWQFSSRITSVIKRDTRNKFQKNRFLDFAKISLIDLIIMDNDRERHTPATFWDEVSEITLLAADQKAESGL